MAEEFSSRSEPLLNLNRRKFLTTAAVGTTAVTFVPNVTPSETALIHSAKTLSKSSAPSLKLCAANARRLMQIARRNELRREANLPLLPIAKELRQMKAAARSRTSYAGVLNLQASYSGGRHKCGCRAKTMTRMGDENAEEGSQPEA
jgi:hypothetical protein